MDLMGSFFLLWTRGWSLVIDHALKEQVIMKLYRNTSKVFHHIESKLICGMKKEEFREFFTLAYS